MVSLPGALEAEEPAEPRWGQLEEVVEEVAGCPVEVEVDPYSPDQASRFPRSTTEAQCLTLSGIHLNATMTLNDPHRRNYYRSRGVKPTGAVSGAASGAAASVGGVVPEGWRTSSRWPGPRN